MLAYFRTLVLEILVLAASLVGNISPSAGFDVGARGASG